MVKELSFDMTPLIRSYQYYSYPLGILKSNNYSNYEYCLLRNFKTIFFGGNMQFYVDEYGFWNEFKISIIENIDKKNIHTEIIKAINYNQYIHLTSIDEYYIPSRIATSKDHFLHDILIIGYEKDELITVGYNDKGLYNKETIKVDLFVNSLTPITKATLVKVKNTNLKLDNKDILKSLDVYFTSKRLDIFKTKNTILDSNSWVYGIDAMGKMIQKMREMENDFLFHNLLLCIESKYLTLSKLEKVKIYLKNPQIITEYKEILGRYETIRLKIFKKIIKENTFDEEVDQFEYFYYNEKQFADRWKAEVIML